MHVDPVSVGLVVPPVALVVVSVCVGELSPPLSFVVHPFALVNGSVRPLLFAETVAQVAQPFAVVLDVVFEADQWLFLAFESSVLLVFVGEEAVVGCFSGLLFLLSAVLVVDFENISVILLDYGAFLYGECFDLFFVFVGGFDGFVDC